MLAPESPDIPVLTETDEELQIMIEKIVSAGKGCVMKRNIGKTKVMKIGRGSDTFNISIDGIVLEQVQSFQYLGSLITPAEVRRRISMGKKAFGRAKGLLIPFCTFSI